MSNLDAPLVADEDRVEPQSSSVGAAGHEPFRSVGFNLSSLGYAVSRRFRERLAPLRLEPREFALLRAVAAAEGQSQQALSERLQIPASRMVAFVDALQNRGLLERRPNPHDRRAHALHLTDGGRELLRRGMSVAIALEDELCAGLEGGERNQLLDLLGRVASQLGLRPGTHSAHAEQSCSNEPE